VSGRLVAVFGCSSWRGSELHPACALRLAHAAAEATPSDAVLFSGRSVETELMERAWRGVSERVLLDPHARSTYDNAVGLARSARELGVREIVLVTSGWHGRRAQTLVRAALRDFEGRLHVATTDEQGSRARRCRELICWTLVPAQAALAARRR
jgi:uncharacterized SAM-binding protein YcdF (DUF218 family)